MRSSALRLDRSRPIGNVPLWADRTPDGARRRDPVSRKTRQLSRQRRCLAGEELPAESLPPRLSNHASLWTQPKDSFSPVPRNVLTCPAWPTTTGSSSAEPPAAGNSSAPNTSARGVHASCPRVFGSTRFFCAATNAAKSIAIRSTSAACSRPLNRPRLSRPDCGARAESSPKSRKKDARPRRQSSPYYLVCSIVSFYK